MNRIKISTLILFITSTLLADVINEPKKIIKKVLHQKTKGELIDANSSQANGKWQGYYHAILPCPNCKGIDTWLHLTMEDNRGKYEMREKFLGVKNRYSIGGLAWKNDGKIASLMSYNDRNLSLKDNSIIFLDKPEYKLLKFDEFDDNDSVLLVNPKDVLAGKVRGKRVVGFDGMINFNKLTKDGYKSSKAKYVIHCKNKKFELSHTSYYKGRYGMRGFVHVDSNTTRGHFDINTSSLVAQAYKRYCDNNHE